MSSESAPLDEYGVRAVRDACRRVDPNGKQALFTTPPQAARDQLRPGDQKDGRQAFYSTGPRRTCTAVVRCKSCQSRSRVALLDLGARLVSISAWLPGRQHRHWMRCPACHQRCWCSIGWYD